MKKNFSLLSSIVIFGGAVLISTVSCNKQESLSPSVDFSPLFEDGILRLDNFEGKGVDFVIENTGVPSRSGLGETYSVSAIAQDGITVDSYVTLDNVGPEFVVEHFSEDLELIATLVYNDKKELTDVMVAPFLPDDPLAPNWWACTKYYYKNAGGGNNGSMKYAITCDWLPCSTLRAVSAGLYCMGLSNYVPAKLSETEFFIPEWVKYELDSIGLVKYVGEDLDEFEK